MSEKLTITHLDAGPAPVMPGNQTILLAASHLLTAEEIAEAVAEGRRQDEEAKTLAGVK